MSIQVTLIGGPADLQRHTIRRDIRTLAIACLSEQSAMYASPHADYTTARVHTHHYDIREVAHNVFVGLWQRRWG